MNIETLQKSYLLMVSFVVLLITLTYGISPNTTMNSLFSFAIETTNHLHLFRVLMGMYFGIIAFWLIGAFKKKWRIASLLLVIFIMCGLALGRLLSLIIDGKPNWLLITYLILEISVAITGWILLKNKSLKN